QPAGGGDEGVDPARGEAGEGVVAGGPALLRRRAGWAGRAFARRLVHEDQAGPVRLAQAFVPPGRGVARPRLADRVPEAVGLQEVRLEGVALRTQQAVLPSRREGSGAPGARRPPLQVLA